MHAPFETAISLSTITLSPQLVREPLSLVNSKYRNNYPALQFQKLLPEKQKPGKSPVFATAW